MDSLTRQQNTGYARVNPGTRKLYWLNAFAVGLLLLVIASGCKKSNDNADDDLPVFGTCTPAISSGGMTYSSVTGKYTYVTSGGGKIVIDPANTIIISHNDYPGFTLEFWGSTSSNIGSYYHENMNGKHVKDRVGNCRSIIFPDGAKITYYTEQETGPIKSITIYDAGQVNHINPACNTLEYSAGNLSIAKKLDDAEADGEAAVFEFTATGILFSDVYTETTAGVKVMNKIPIAEIYRNNPGQLNDYWP